MKEAMPLFVLLASYGFGALFGRSTSKPLWIAGAIPTTTICGILFSLIAMNEQPSRWSEAFSVVGPFIIGGGIFYGALSYWAASRARKDRKSNK